jgi:NAD+-dependent secondary alcohol dehydrogenase Adh1
MQVVRKAVSLLGPGTWSSSRASADSATSACGACGRLTAATVVAVDPDPEALELALDCGAHHAVPAGEGAGPRIAELTGGAGAQAVIGFVGEGDAGVVARDGAGPGHPLRRRSTWCSPRSASSASAVGTHDELRELIALTAADAVSLRTRSYPLDAFADAIADLENGRMRGRGVLVP